jgi:hypothetical protein
MPNWSTEIFTIKKKSNYQIQTYLLQDYQKQDKIKHPDVYLVEKILRRTIKPS